MAIFPSTRVLRFGPSDERARWGGSIAIIRVIPGNRRGGSDGVRNGLLEAAEAGRRRGLMQSRHSLRTNGLGR